MLNHEAVNPCVRPSKEVSMKKTKAGKSGISEGWGMVQEGTLPTAMGAQEECGALKKEVV